jgi:hypothetical protein
MERLVHENVIETEKQGACNGFWTGLRLPAQRID